MSRLISATGLSAAIEQLRSRYTSSPLIEDKTKDVITHVLYYVDRAIETAETVEAEPTQQAWVSVEDRLPKLGEEVLICDRGDAPYMSVWSLDKLNDAFIWEGKDGEWYALDEATHWMPLPKQPKEVQHEQAD